MCDEPCGAICFSKLHEVKFGISGCFLVLQKALLGSCCVVVWVLFIAFCCFKSLGYRNTKKLPDFCCI